jgi:uncharacterized LabA/DUF88 family protein
MTDVQLASHLVSDAHKGDFDVALLISGDRDLVPAIEMVKKELTTKRIVVVFPPMRSCDDLRNVAHAYIHVTEAVLKASLFPDVVTDAIGNSATRPQSWS